MTPLPEPVTHEIGASIARDVTFCLPTRSSFVRCWVMPPGKSLAIVGERRAVALDRNVVHKVEGLAEIDGEGFLALAHEDAGRATRSREC